MAQAADWTYELSAAHVAELDRAVASAEATNTALLDIGVSGFRLPRLEPVLAKIRDNVLHGRGFHLIRGIPVERYSVPQTAIAFWGIGQHLGEPVPQNGRGHMLGHVTNVGLNYDDPEVRGYQTNARLPYHTDLSDVVALVCLRSSKSGGLSSIVSSTSLWNELVRRRPQFARVLQRPLYYTRWGEIPEGKLAHESAPVFTPWQGRMIATYVRSAIKKAQALPEVPRLTDEQIEAMDFLDSLCVDPCHHLDMAFAPGDMQILCNHFIFHSRTAYEDWPDPGRRRHLLRLWLASAGGPELPPFMCERTGRTASGRPDGIRVPGVAPAAPLVAV
jgi:hypothetical protein